MRRMRRREYRVWFKASKEMMINVYVGITELYFSVKYMSINDLPSLISSLLQSGTDDEFFFLFLMYCLPLQMSPVQLGIDF